MFFGGGCKKSYCKKIHWKKISLSVSSQELAATNNQGSKAYIEFESVQSAAVVPYLEPGQAKLFLRCNFNISAMQLPTAAAKSRKKVYLKYSLFQFFHKNWLQQTTILQIERLLRRTKYRILHVKMKNVLLKPKPGVKKYVHILMLMFMLIRNLKVSK